MYQKLQTFQKLQPLTKSQTADHQTKVPQVTSCQRDHARRWPQSSSCSHSRWCITFAQSLPEAGLKRDASAEEPHLPTWGDEVGPSNLSDFSDRRGGPLLPTYPWPQIEEFLGGEEESLASIGAGDCIWWDSIAWAFPQSGSENSGRFPDKMMCRSLPGGFVCVSTTQGKMSCIQGR